MTQHDRLKEARMAAGFKTGTAAAEKLGISVGTYNGHENGHRGLTIRSAEEYAKLFNVRSSWLLTGEEPMHYIELEDWDKHEKEWADKRKGVEWGTYLPGKPYMGKENIPEIEKWPPAGENGAYDVVGEWSIPGDFLTQTLKSSSPQVFLISVPDDVMKPYVSAGDRIIVDPSQTVVRGNALYVIEDQDRELHIRWLSKAVGKPSTKGDITVITMFPVETYLTHQSDLKVIGKAVGKIGAITFSNI